MTRVAQLARGAERALDGPGVLATNGANYDVMPADIIAWLSLTPQTHSHRIVGASLDSLTLRFDGNFPDGLQFLKRAADFCPDHLGREADERVLAKAVAHLGGGGDLFLWWD